MNQSHASGSVCSLQAFLTVGGHVQIVGLLQPGRHLIGHSVVGGGGRRWGGASHLRLVR